MENFFSTAFSFPTIIFSVLLGIISIYWFFTILGLFDIEILDFDMDIDMDLEYGGEVGPVGGLAGVMIALGLTGLPITIIVSFIILFAWFCTYIASLYLLSFFDMGLGFWLAAIVTMIFALILSVPMTIAMTKPMQRFFRVSYATKSHELLGEMCQVISSEISEQFGEAELHKEGNHFIFQVRNRQQNSIKKGDKVVLLEYNREDNYYLVKKL